jgi:hypothetical protein
MACRKLARTLQTSTNGSGGYSFGGLGPGTYVVREQLPAGWRQSSPAALAYTVTAASGRSVAGDDFGNYRSAAAVALRNVLRGPVADALFGPVDLVATPPSQSRRPSAT